VDHTKKLTHLSLCTGYGGIDLGLKRAIGNVRTIAYVEIEAFAICNLVAKMESGLIDTAPLWPNLKTFPWELFSGRVDILSGGFPCQPFSTAGRRKGDEDPRHLWPYITKGIQQLGKPSIVFLENVEGIISSKLKGDHWTDPENTPVLLHVLRELERLDYKATAGIFSASEIGAPHQRKRVFILGVRNELTKTSLDCVTKLISNTKESRTTWPAYRGQAQNWYEPPRVTVGNTQHNGLLNSKKRRNSDETSNRSEEGQDSTSELKGTSRPCGNRGLQASELGHTDGRNEGPYGWKYRILLSETEERKTNRLEWSSNYTKPRKVEPKMGGNVDGIANRLDYAELSKSCDNRTDELRMLGNGVVPDTATRAFTTLWKELAKP